MNLPSGKTIMIIAGEASADLHGANLVKAIQKKTSDISFYGMGGNMLREAGVNIIVDSSSLSVVGITEIAIKFHNILKALSKLKKFLKNTKPDLLILIDFPDFNLNLSKTAKKINIPVLYYISPQVWAWRSGRIRKIRRRIDHLAVIFPFEEDFFRQRDIQATFVGHPILDTNIPVKKNYDLSSITIGILPGSREKEITTLLPIMLDAAGILKKKFNNIRFVISRAPSIKEEYLKNIITKHNPDNNYTLLEGGIENIVNEIDFAMAVSGTVTLEIAIAGLPMVIIYKVSLISYLLGRLLVNLTHIGLANLIAEESIVPELVQYDATSPKIAETIEGILKNRQEYDWIRKKLLTVREKLGKPGASKRAADIAMRMLDRN